MTSSPPLTTILTALLLVVATAGAAPVSADGGVFDDFRAAEDEDSSRVDTILAGVGGLIDRISYRAASSSLLGNETDDETAAEEDAQALRDTFNNNSAGITAYVNNRFSADADEWAVIEITHERGDASTTHYLVAYVNGTSGGFENASMVTSTDRDVDKRLTLSDYASDNAATELDYFVEEYVSEDRDIDRAYFVQLGSKYKGHVTTPDGVE